MLSMTKVFFSPLGRVLFPLKVPFHSYIGRKATFLYLLRASRQDVAATARATGLRRDRRNRTARAAAAVAANADATATGADTNTAHTTETASHPRRHSWWGRAAAATSFRVTCSSDGTASLLPHPGAAGGACARQPCAGIRLWAKACPFSLLWIFPHALQLEWTW